MAISHVWTLQHAMTRHPNVRPHNLLQNLFGDMKYGVRARHEMPLGRYYFFTFPHVFEGKELTAEFIKLWAKSDRFLTGA